MGMADDLKRLNIITHTDDTIRHKLNKNLKILYKIIDLNNYIIIITVFSFYIDKYPFITFLFSSPQTLNKINTIST